MDPTRVSAGTEVWRVHADTRQQMMAVYPHVGLGWAFPVGITPPTPVGHATPSDLVGITVRTQEGPEIGDLLADGRVVECSSVERPGWTKGGRGQWFTVRSASESAAVIARGDVFAPRFTARWRGLPFQLVGRSFVRQGAFDAVYLGRDADVAESVGLAKTDAGGVRSDRIRRRVDGRPGCRVAAWRSRCSELTRDRYSVPLLDRAIQRARSGELTMQSVIWAMAAGSLFVPSGVDPGDDLSGLKPVYYPRGDSLMLAAFSAADGANSLRHLAPYVVVFAGADLIRSMPVADGLVVNPGLPIGFEVPPEGVRAFRQEISTRGAS